MIKNKFTLTAWMLVFSGLCSANATTINKIAKPQYQIHSAAQFAVPAGMLPAQISLAYGFKNLPYKGDGQTIGIVVAFDNPNVEADLGVFSSTLGLPDCTTANGCFKKIGTTSSIPTDGVWGVEAAIQVEWAHALAPNAKILLVEAVNDDITNLMAAVNLAVQNGATVVAMGWGIAEFQGETALDTNFPIGKTSFVAASGSTGNGTLYPSVSPNVLSVGGTVLKTDSTGNYISESAWSGSGGGLSSYEAQPDYQTNFPIPNNPNKMRGTPDVAFHADQTTGFAIYDSYQHGGWMVVGGTSPGTAQWAALIALIKSGTHKNITNMNAAFYNAAKLKYTLTYNQITSGTNGNCGYYCTAIAGYNYVTGLGTPQAQFLAYNVILNSLMH